MTPLGLIALTGGPGGGKTTLLAELAADPAWAGRFAALPEAISLLGGVGVRPSQQLFQRLMVHLQAALEDGLCRALAGEGPRLILCHRGCLDPLAYWRQRGWPEEAFFAYTNTSRATLYRRYVAAIHLVTAADGAVAHYRRWPEAHRPETPAQAVALDRLLEQAWGGHPRYYRLDNAGRDWPAKAAAASDILRQLVAG